MAPRPFIRTLSNRLLLLASILAAVLAAGTFGYRWITGGAAGWIDCLYMTVITVTTIGYGEIVDLSTHPGGRIFTMGLAFAGVGLITYVVGNVTQFAVDGELRRAWRTYRMHRTVSSLSGHYILAGWSDVGPSIVRELTATHRPWVILTPHAEQVRRELGNGAEIPPILEGDPTDDSRLLEAGIERAAGLFAVAEEDTINTVVCLSARRLNPEVRIVANVLTEGNAVKMRKVGADATVSAHGIGGLRMTSEMVRPNVVSFLDTMLRGAEALRVEEVPAGPTAEGRRLADLPLSTQGQSLLLAVHNGADWIFNPAGDYRIRTGDVLVFMVTAGDRPRIEQILGRG